MIQTFSRRCGARKTTLILKDTAHKVACGEDVTILSPSKQLTQQSFEAYKRMGGLRAHMITSDTEASTVKALGEFYMHGDDQGHALFATHAGHLLLRLWGFIHRRSDRHVVWDEIPTIELPIPCRIPHTRNIVGGFLKLEDRTGEYGRIVATDPRGFQELVQSDEGLAEGFRSLARYLASDLVEVLVKSRSFEDLMTGKRDDMEAVGLIKPELFEGYKSATVIGANVSSSVFYRYYSNLGVRFIDHRLQAKHSDTPHENGAEITIHYAYETDRWSSALANTETPAPGVTYLDQLVQATERLFTGKRYAYLANNEKVSRSGRVYNKKEVSSPLAVQLPNSPYGHNGYMDIDNIAVWSALNPRTSHFHLMAQNTGISPAEYTIAGVNEVTYQTCMRGAARDESNHNPKAFVVAARGTADWLARLFPGCKVVPLPGIAHQPPGRSYKYERRMTDSERIAEDRRHEKARLLADLTRLRQVQHQGTLFATKYSAAGIDVDVSNVPEFIRQLEQFSHISLADKEQNYLVAPGLFDPHKAAETRRGKANVVALRHLYLDNDGGDLTLEEFAALLPKWEIVGYNTHSSTLENPRWRAIIPTSDVMTVDVYEHLIKHVMRVLNRAHFYSDAQFEKSERIRRNPENKRHGFDPSKLNAACLMYLPCTNPEHPEARMFNHYAGKKRRVISAFDVLSHLHDVTVPEPVLLPAQPAPTATPLAGSKLAAIRQRLVMQDTAGKIEAAKAKYLSVPVGQKLRYRAFYMFGLELWRLGLNEGEIGSHLLSVAVDQKRRNQIKGILRSLQRYASRSRGFHWPGARQGSYRLGFVTAPPIRAA